MSKSRSFRSRFSRQPRSSSWRNGPDRFSSILEPAIWLLVVAGVVAVCAVSVIVLVAGEVDKSLWGMAVLPLLVAAVFALFRFVRGCFDGRSD